jgi:hypothetical protein
VKSRVWQCQRCGWLHEAWRCASSCPECANAGSGTFKLIRDAVVEIDPATIFRVIDGEPHLQCGFFILRPANAETRARMLARYHDGDVIAPSERRVSSASTEGVS